MNELEKPFHIFLVKVVQSVLLVLPARLFLLLFTSELHLTDVRNFNQSNYEALVIQFLLAWHGVCCFQVRLNVLTALRHFLHLFYLTGVDIHELLRIDLLDYTRLFEPFKPSALSDTCSLLTYLLALVILDVEPSAVLLVEYRLDGRTGEELVEVVPILLL